MKKTKKTIPVDPSASVGAQLGAIATNLASTPTLSAKDRRLAGARSRRVPDALIELVLKLAETNGGQVAGMPIDVAASRATLTQVSEATAAADASRRIAAQMDDEALSQRIIVAERAFAIHTALRRLVNTPEGQPFVRASEEMASVLRNQPRLRRARNTEAPASPSEAASSSTPASTTPATSHPATTPVVTAPAAATTAANPSVS